MKILKKVLTGYGIILVIYWSIAGLMALSNAGANWGRSGFDDEVLSKELSKRFLP